MCASSPVPTWWQGYDPGCERNEMKILIVEDDPDMRAILTRMLQADGYEIETASDSETALSFASSFDPDLVLLDVVLGGEDGRDILVKLRVMSDVPTIFLTGRGLEMDRIAGLKL